MKIELDYYIEDEVFVIHQNQVFKVEVIDIQAFITKESESVCYTCQYVDKEISGARGNSFTKQFSCDRMFISKQELLDSL